MRDWWVCSRSHGHSSRRVAHQLDEALQLARHGRGELRDPQRREVVGVDLAVEVGPRHLGDRLVGQAEALQHGDRRVVGGSSTASLMSDSTRW